MSNGTPYRRLSGFYFFYFATLGSLLPFWGLYLQWLGYGGTAIGLAIGALFGTKIVAPVVWGWLADHYGHRMRLIRVAAFLSIVLFALIPLADDLAGLIALMIAYGFFWNAALPQFEAVTFNHLGDEERNYGRIRLWGSLGFIVTVSLVAPALERWGMGLLPYWVTVMLVGIWALSLSVNESSPDAQIEIVHAEGLAAVVRRPEVASLLAVCFLMQLSHGAYYSFFSIYLEDAGYSRGSVGIFWALGVISEILVFLFMPQLLERIGARRLMLAAIAVTAIRWMLLAAAIEILPVLILAQIMHMASFGLYHAVAVNLVHQMFRGRLQGRGQALYSSVSFGAGGALGSVLSGWIWDLSPGATIFWLSTVAALVALAIGWVGLKSPVAESK